MKDFCVDLKLAKELKEKGFPQKSTFYYTNWILLNEICFEYNANNYEIIDSENKTRYVCPTSDELLKELPKEIQEFNLDIDCFGEGYDVSYITFIFDDIIGLFDGRTTGLKTNKKLSNALAEMWIYLKKEGYLK